MQMVQMGSEPMGSDLIGSEPMGSEPMGSDLMGSDPVGSEVMGSDPAGSEVMGSDPIALSGSRWRQAFVWRPAGPRYSVRQSYSVLQWQFDFCT